MAHLVVLKGNRGNMTCGQCGRELRVGELVGRPGKANRIGKYWPKCEDCARRLNIT